MATKGPPSLEILEAGTGHGALTLYLARAIHAANAPQLEGKANIGSPEGHGSTRNDPNTTVDEGSHGSKTVNKGAVGYAREERPGKLYKHSEDQRGAVIHTVDLSSKHSASGKQIVEGFRHGMYAGDVEFHAGDVSNWIDEQILSRSSSLKVEPFLSHIILDMPSIEHHVQKAASVLHVNGSLMAFNPSISQIVAILDMVKRQCLPLHLERVLELGLSMTGGREWDVRFVKSRAETRSGFAEVAQLVNDGDEGTSDDDPQRDAVVKAAEIEKLGHEETQAFGKQDPGWRMVCRPKVGQRVLAGGFLGVWKKMK
ncbi:hypothetical protein JMJ35_001698 [Cladonia borealis]|uniref:tRNA (adenine(58)-N(1))-methyltransferase catalytic subunit TRM61 n=1 Tax=Cladonia borealis TaxID=184061 RepID=A0AA39R8M0_9LECA|nr:hypothetical protein JMJ35_001698 [Cladonia borealis]